MLSFPKFTLPIAGTHVVEDDALVRWHVVKVNVWAWLPDGLWEDASTIIKPCSCVGVFVGGTVHPFRVILEVPAMLGPLEFWDWQLVQVLVEACHNVPPVGAFLSLTRLLGNSH